MVILGTCRHPDLRSIFCTQMMVLMEQQQHEEALWRTMLQDSIGFLSIITKASDLGIGTILIFTHL